MLVAIGGKLDLEGEREILKRLLAEARGVQSNVLVVTSATGYPDETRQDHEDAFARLGIPNVTTLHLRTPQEADDPQAAARADLILFTGGDQLRLVRALGGTDFMSMLAKREQAGAIVAGTSAGAAAMAQTMIYGESADDDPEREIVSLKDGFGLAAGYIIDTHFDRRGRYGRLFDQVAAHPDKVGLGLDENTAAIFHGDGSIEALGPGHVTIIDDPESATARVELSSGQFYDSLLHGLRTGPQP